MTMLYLGIDGRFFPKKVEWQPTEEKREDKRSGGRLRNHGPPCWAAIRAENCPDRVSMGKGSGCPSSGTIDASRGVTIIDASNSPFFSMGGNAPRQRRTATTVI